MDKNGNKILAGFDISSTTIGITLLLDDGSEYGKIIELTHISPKVSKKIKGIESLLLKKKIFDEYITKFKDIGIDRCIIEAPLTSSNNEMTVATLLRFNGMLSSSIYDILGIVPDFITSYDARKFAFPDLMAIRKYNKKGEQYPYKKLLKEIKDSKFVLFGAYSFDADKKTILQQKVADIFPNIEWIYNKKGELTKENFDAVDSWVACYGFMNKLRHNEELVIKADNIQETDEGIKYDVSYWGKTFSKITYTKKEA